LVDGLRPGHNRITAWAAGLPSAGLLNVFNSPVTGPIFSGPHQAPFICRTQDNGLGAPTDSNCSASSRTDFYYRDTAGNIKPLADPSNLPPDLSQTTLSDGRVVDYVIRMESGTINRAVYRWAILIPGGDPYAGWNGRFVYRHGGGCSAGHQQGLADPDLVLDDLYLKRGFAMLTSSLNVMQTACNDVLSAETASMVKERVIESLVRPPVWTIGVGGSGGSMLIQMSSQNYPGLFDGVIPSASFPDNTLVIQPHCRLLYNYFDSSAAVGLTEGQRTSISGIPVEDSCRGLGSRTANVIDASAGCGAAVPAELVFNPVSNPTGIRCTLFESLVNVYGRDPATGFARRTMDNVGRQYGLEALEEGSITLDQFLDLNERIGGFDVNGDFSLERSVGDLEAIETAYRTGRVNRGSGGTASVPIIDVRVWSDRVNNVHVSVPTYEFRARLRATNGSASNHVMFRARRNVNVRAMEEESVAAMSAWLDGIKSDTSAISLRAKVAKNRPARATDACWVDNGERINEPAEIGQPGKCNDEYPAFSTPDMRAGKPLGSLVIKCQLRPVDPAEYGNPTPVQVERLREIFPDGVCNWGEPGVGEVPLQGTDLSFGPEQTVEAVARTLTLRVRPNRPRPARQGRSVRLTASLGPCPATIWQRVVFERSVRKYPHARKGPRSRAKVWRVIGSRIVTGRSCTASTRVERIRSNTRLRARSEALTGFRAVVAEPRTVRVR
jgi:hypothetical protein